MICALSLASCVKSGHPAEVGTRALGVRRSTATIVAGSILVAVSGCGDSETASGASPVSAPPDTITQLSTSTVVAPADSVAQATTSVAVVQSTSSVPALGCNGAMSSRDAASAFVDAMLTARLTGDFTPVAGSLGEVPGVFTGEPPYCWTECAGARRTISVDHAFTDEGGDASGAQYLFTTLPVSYAIGNDYVDVWESWRLDAAPEGYVASGFSIEEPPFSREGALAVIVEYFDAIQRQDWNAVAAMLDDGAINPE